MTGNCLGRFAEFKPEMLGTSKVVVRGFPLDGVFVIYKNYL
jgi:hypothetical protein